MCFSAQASFTAAAILSVVGVATFSKAHSPKIRPFASIPFIFAIQQGLEGIVWVTLNAGDTTSLLHKTSVFGFLFFANLFWPVWVPSSIYTLEDNPLRKKILLSFFSVGVLVSILSLLLWIFLGRTAQKMDHHIVYTFLSFPFATIRSTYMYFIEVSMYAAYFIATILPFFISSVSRMWLFGLLIGIGWVVAEIFYAFAFGSVWCFFAAIASVFIYFIVVRYNKVKKKRVFKRST